MTESKYGNTSPQWGVVSSPLVVAASPFESIAAHRLPTDPRPVPQPQAYPVESWQELRALLRDPALPTAAVDAIWVWLIERSRVYGEDATLVCVTLAMPMLAGTAGLFAAPASPRRHDIESEVLAGFLAHLKDVRLNPPGVWHRLRWASYRAAMSAARQLDSTTEPVADHDLDLFAEDGRVMTTEPGHPETVLALAVADGVITAEAAELIVLTRWEHRSLNTVADVRGESHWALRKRRQRAEARLVAWLAERAHDVADASTTETRVLNALPSNNHRPAIEPAEPMPRGRRRAARRTPPPQPSQDRHNPPTPTPTHSTSNDQEARSCA
ncbi:hypothetical protein [Nocardia asiatica]